MNSKVWFLLCGCAFRLSLGDFIDVDTKIDPELVNQNQVFLNRKERFIKFDTKDNELEIELGISVPFIKVPLTAKRDLSGVPESKISINAPGLIIAGMLMLTSFIIVPLLFATSPENSFGFQRKAEKRDIWSVMEDVNDVLSQNGINSSSCMQKSICWITKASKDGKEGSIGNWINSFLNTWWINRLIGGTFVEEAVSAASDEKSCTAKYSHCSLTNKHISSFAKMLVPRKN